MVSTHVPCIGAGMLRVVDWSCLFVCWPEIHGQAQGSGLGSVLRKEAAGTSGLTGPFMILFSSEATWFCLAASSPASLHKHSIMSGACTRAKQQFVPVFMFQQPTPMSGRSLLLSPPQPPSTLSKLVRTVLQGAGVRNVLGALTSPDPTRRERRERQLAGCPVCLGHGGTAGTQPLLYSPQAGAASCAVPCRGTAGICQCVRSNRKDHADYWKTAGQLQNLQTFSAVPSQFAGVPDDGDSLGKVSGIREILALQGAQEPQRGRQLAKCPACPACPTCSALGCKIQS